MPEREEQKVPIQDVPVRGDDIRLGQFIKLANLVESGGVAKEVIAAGSVTVNGETDTRRGRHLRAGDEVTVHDEDGTPLAAARFATDGAGADDDTDDFYYEASADGDFARERWRNL